MKYRISLLLATVLIASAGCVAVPAAGIEATPSTAPTLLPGPATMTPAPLVSTSAPTATAAPTTPAPGTTPGPYGHAADYAWLEGQYTVSGPCHKLEYDPAHADAHGGATFVSFSGVNAPPDGSFVRVEGRFIESDRPVYPNCPESTYLVAKVVPAGATGH